MRLSRTAFQIISLAGLAAPAVDAQSTALRVERPGRDASLFTIEALRRLPNDTISFSAHGAPPVHYRAVRVSDVLAAAGTPLDSLRIGRIAWVVAAIAHDGYTVVFSAAELDPTIGPTRAWLAFERNTGPLAADEGPFRLVVPADAKASRSARQVTTLRVVDAMPSPGRN
ncbi:MAG TPA: hypothetical protein VIK25_15265 [Gemmatimonadaceae bacterium]